MLPCKKKSTKKRHVNEVQRSRSLTKSWFFWIQILQSQRYHENLFNCCSWWKFRSSPLSYHTFGGFPPKWPAHSTQMNPHLIAASSRSLDLIPWKSAGGRWEHTSSWMTFHLKNKPFRSIFWYLLSKKTGFFNCKPLKPPKIFQESKTFWCKFFRKARAKCTTGKKRMRGLPIWPTSCKEPTGIFPHKSADWNCFLHHQKSDGALPFFKVKKNASSRRIKWMQVANTSTSGATGTAILAALAVVLALLLLCH